MPPVDTFTLVNPFADFALHAAWTVAAAMLGLSPIVACLPFVHLASKFVRRELATAYSSEESRLAMAVETMVFAGIWCGWAVFVAWLLFLPLGFKLGTERCLAIYAPHLAQALRGSDRSKPYNLVSKYVMYGFYDVPFTAALWVCRECLGLRLLSPFASVVCGQVVQGSMPFASDAEILAKYYNVCAVVNMCVEWRGPKKAYGKYGIVQCWLPTQDTCIPSVTDLKRGAAFIQEQLAANPGKRVFIHCKGGIGRASTMTLAHYLINRRDVPREAMDRIRAHRPVARDVTNYASIREIVKELEATKR